MTTLLTELIQEQITKVMALDNDELAAAMQAKSPGQVMAEFLFALSQLLVHHKVPHEPTAVSVNFHGRALRVDIATLSDDGQHLEQWLLGLDANLLSEQCGQPVSLPGTQGPSH